MNITVRCKCNAKFTITSKCKNKGAFVCQNCSRPLPGEMSDTIKAMINEYTHLVEELRDSQLYEIEIYDTKL